MLSGDNGVLQRATDAKTKSDEAQIRERIQLAYHSALTGGKGSYTKESLEDELENEFGENNYSVDDSDNTNWILSAQGQNVTIPAGIKTTNAYLASEIFEASGTTQGKMHIGDYVDYKVNYDNLFTGGSGGTGSYKPDDFYAGKWRVLSVDGDLVKIVSAGVPLTYTYSNSDLATNYTKLTSGFFSTSFGTTDLTYKEHGFKSSNGTIISNDISEIKTLFKNAKGTKIENEIPVVNALTLEDVDRLSGQTGVYDCSSYYTGLLAVPSGSNYAMTWLPSNSATFFHCVFNNGMIIGSGGSLGIRLVVTLNSNTKYLCTTTDNNGISTWNINE